MSFTNKSFGFANYAKFRPTYPPKFYNYLFDYHKSHADRPAELLVDLACGTGQATRPLAAHSKKVVGMDYSSSMLEEARKNVPEANVEFVPGSDRDLIKTFGPESVDVLTVAEGAHWFSYPEFWHQSATVLRKGGTLALWGYWVFAFPGHPELATVIEDYAHAPDQCGPYWDKGREILDSGYESLHESIPKNVFDNIEYRVNAKDRLRPDEPLELVQNNVPIGSIIQVLKTWSGYFNYSKANPDSPDLADAVLERITQLSGLTAQDEVTVKWNTVMLLATKH